MENETVVTDGILEQGSVDADGNAVIPDGVTDIDNEAFLNCSSLVSAAIPEGVRSIGRSAFASEETLLAIREAGFADRIRYGTDFPITHYRAIHPKEDPTKEELAAFLLR